MATVAIICEYNPFHNGHKYHIDKIREEFGSDTVIVALMSGNFTQRGETAVADKGLRAKWAVDGGINLCLELPFPYSISSAEIFARSAVDILNSLGTVDYLSFGSESGDIKILSDTAKCMLSSEFNDRIRLEVSSELGKRIGYPALCERILKDLLNDSYAPLSSNNILAIEYLKAIISSDSKMIPHTVKRIGADYLDLDFSDSQFASARAIRQSIENSDIYALKYVPCTEAHEMLAAIEDGVFPCSEEKLSSAIISKLRLSSPVGITDIHDASGGLYNRLLEKAKIASDITTLIKLTETKKYTTARIRRAMWCMFFGVTSSEISKPPMYTQLLGMDALGRTELKRIKKKGTVQIVTKPSKYDHLDDSARIQKVRSDLADSVFQLTKPAHCDGNAGLRFSPYVKDIE